MLPILEKLAHLQSLRLILSAPLCGDGLLPAVARMRHLRRLCLRAGSGIPPPALRSSAAGAHAARGAAAHPGAVDTVAGLLELETLHLDGVPGFARPLLYASCAHSQENCEESYQTPTDVAMPCKRRRSDGSTSSHSGGSVVSSPRAACAVALSKCSVTEGGDDEAPLPQLYRACRDEFDQVPRAAGMLDRLATGAAVSVAQSYRKLSRPPLHSSVRQIDLTSLTLDHLPDLMHNAATADALKTVFARAPALRTLSLAGFRGPTDDLLAAAARYCPQLRSLNCSSCPSLTDDGLCALLSFPPRLRSLRVARCDHISGAAVAAVALHHAASLRELDLWACGAGGAALAQVLAHLGCHRGAGISASLCPGGEQVALGPGGGCLELVNLGGSWECLGVGSRNSITQLRTELQQAARQRGWPRTTCVVAPVGAGGRSERELSRFHDWA